MPVFLSTLIVNFAILKKPLLFYASSLIIHAPSQASVNALSAFKLIANSAKPDTKKVCNGYKMKVTKREYNQWVKWLKKQGYCGPFAGLTRQHEWVKLLQKELKRDPPAILETRPRDPRTIASNLTRYERGKRRAAPGEEKLAVVDQYEQVQAFRTIFEQNLRMHIKSVFNLLDAYARQLKVPYEPEYFLTDSQSLVFAPQLEIKSSFAAVEGHYRDMKLGKDVSEYKQAVEAYQSDSLKLYGIIIKKAYQHPLTIADTEVALEVLRKVVRVKLASVRFKLYLEGIETDRGTIFETLSEVSNLRGQNGKPLEELLEFVSRKDDRYKDDMQEESKVILELLERLKKNYEIMKRLEKAIIRDVEGEKLRGMLPPGTKCRFCPPASIEEAASTIRGGAL